MMARAAVSKLGVQEIKNNAGKLTFGSISDIETYAILLVGNMSAGMPKYFDGSGDREEFIDSVKGLEYTVGVPGTTFQSILGAYEWAVGSTKQPHEYSTTSVACVVS
jgi:filamentous hemagglutinin